MNSIQRQRNASARIALLVAFILCFLLLLFQRSGPNFTQPAQRKAADVVSPITQILSVPIRRFETMMFGVQDRRRAYDENIALRNEVAQLRDNQAQFDLLALKVKRYEQILSTNLEADIPPEKIVARVVNETNGPFVRAMLLNAGTQQGVTTGNPVMTPDGLIGHVINTGQRSARVLQLGDLNSRIPVINRRSLGKAILSGDNSERPILAFVQDITDWQAGDDIITSGDDGMLPMGLPIGVVVKTKAGVLLVRLHTEDKPTDWVWVSPYKPITAPLDTEIVGDTKKTGDTEIAADAQEGKAAQEKISETQADIDGEAGVSP